ncbi:MAG: restriction endonuclease subunit S [Candidatus Thiothrix sulfatifontis]|nr:MAG: restriction endonuclease subunit S [Candidatus Thiothrix sulfatifontis]
MILQLAVMGKLVPQDPDDEPASVLLQRIAADFPTSPFAKGRAEKCFDLPQTWEWASLGDFSKIKGGKRLPQNHKFSSNKTPYIYIQVTNMKNGTILSDNLKYLSQETQQEISKYTISKDDLYITIAGTIGDIGIVPEEFDGMNLTENAAKIVFKIINRNWLKEVLSSNLLQTQFFEKTNQQAQPKLALNRIASAYIPLPPLAEQKRIVAKVDSLMALCDKLETLQQQRQQLDPMTQTAVLDALLTPNTGGSSAWQRLNQHMTTLFHTPESVKALRETILQLAVMGKLVPQDPNDEPAAVLLQHIAAEKDRLIQAGKIKRQKPLPAIRDDEKPFELPNGWEWSKLGEYLDIVSGVTLGRKNLGNDLIELPYVRVANVKRGFLELYDIKTVEIKKSEVIKYQLIQDDLLVNEGGDWDKVGRTAIWNSEIPLCLHQNHIIRMRKLSNKFLAKWIEMYMNSFAKNYFQNASKQTTNLASINMTQLKNCPLVIPPSAIPAIHR